MIIVVGSNPSQKSIDRTAFSTSTRSGRLIREWFYSFEDVYFINVSDDPTPNNRPLKSSEINANLDSLRDKLKGADRIVAVGSTAQKACEKLGVKFFHMFHPSLRCRKHNDPNYVITKTIELKQFLIMEPSCQQLSEPL